MQLFCHLLFRYFFYIWSHIILVRNKDTLLQSLILLTIAYYTHIIYLYNIDKKIKKNYWLYSLYTMNYIIVCNIFLM